MNEFRSSFNHFDRVQPVFSYLFQRLSWRNGSRGGDYYNLVFRSSAPPKPKPLFFAVSPSLLCSPTVEEDWSYGHRWLPSLPHLYGLRPGTITVHYPIQTRANCLARVSVKVCSGCMTWFFRTFFSGWGGVCSDNDAGGSKRYRNRLFPVFHWLYDQRDCRYRHRRAGCGIFPDPGSWQGMWGGGCYWGLVAYEQILLAEANLLYSSHYCAVARWFMNYTFAHVLKMAMRACQFSSHRYSPTYWWRSWGENSPQNKQSTALWGCRPTVALEHHWGR